MAQINVSQIGTLQIGQTVKLQYPSSKDGSQVERSGKVEKLFTNGQGLVVEVAPAMYRSFVGDKIIGGIIEVLD